MPKWGVGQRLELAAYWFRKKCFRIFLVSEYKCSLCVCSCVHSVLLLISGDFDFHLSLIERKIMHTFISFRFQSHTFREDGKMYTDIFYLSAILMFEDIYARVKFSYRYSVCWVYFLLSLFFSLLLLSNQVSAFKRTFLPHSLLVISIFGVSAQFKICIEFPFTQFFDVNWSVRSEPKWTRKKDIIDFAYE